MFGINSLKQKKTFPVLKECDKCYVIVYETDDLYYLEEAVIEDSIVNVKTKYQKVIQKKDVSYQIMTFDEVVKE